MPERALWERYKKRLDSLSDLPLNFDLERSSEFTKENGWRVDDYSAELPAEPPGKPVENGSWEIARRMLTEYRFPDPAILTGIFYPDRPLGERVMLLRARWLIFTFHFGVRIGKVVDDEITQDGRAERVFSYNYQTLQGHFERGQIEFSIVKDIQNGAVSFRIHAFSQTGRIANPFVRVGFRLFGRRLQVRFSEQALKRMQSLVQAELAGEEHNVEKAAQPQSVGQSSAAAKAMEAQVDEYQRDGK